MKAVQISYSRVISAPVKDVWAFFDDFSGLSSFLDLQSSISNGKAEKEIGAIRFESQLRLPCTCMHIAATVVSIFSL